MTKVNQNQSITTHYIDDAGNKVDQASYKGRIFKVVTIETPLSRTEKVLRGMLGVALVVASLGMALFFTKIKELFTTSSRTTKTTEEIHKNGINPPQRAKLNVSVPPASKPLQSPSINQKDEQVLNKPYLHDLKLQGKFQPAIEGYKKTQTTDDKPADKVPSVNVSPPVDLTSNLKKITPMPIPPEGVIRNGYGEYLVYRKDSEGNKVSISEDEYRQIFEVLEASRTVQDEEIFADRHHYLEKKIQEKLGEGVKLAFIPRLLYEQIFLRECIQEEIDTKKSLNAKELGLSFVLPSSFEEPNDFMIEMWNQGLEKLKKREAFWQLCIYEDQDYENGFSSSNPLDYRKEHLIKVAAKLNEVALTRFKECKEDGFTFKDISKAEIQEVAFFKGLPGSSHYAFSMMGPSLTERFKNQTTNFMQDNKGLPLGLNHERDEKILQNILQLECSAQAVNHLILYRGSQLANDQVTRKSGEDILPNSLSYGTSYYGGVLYDGGACAATFMRTLGDAHAMFVPLQEQLKGKTPFHAFMVHPIIAMGSKGEIFHGRSKIWNLPPNHDVLGFLTGAIYKFGEIKECCKTSETQDSVEKSFEKYKNEAFRLTG